MDVTIAIANLEEGLDGLDKLIMVETFSETMHASGLDSANAEVPLNPTERLDRRRTLLITKERVVLLKNLKEVYSRHLNKLCLQDR